ncbi:ABC transporter permease [Rossellomorea marisflavi]|uniref:ABC transporter permease n=1 Tax=Rossellomorea marisflavi TaxID=189381 RepID=UPI00115066FB|nr:ABC transporter permease [Rossellomorea marisflavi]UKS65015.1 ABC transporter permease [Rossellomorea marisflavi]WJV19305.1 ABC transporter permease [Rossellomorea marisflavi]
MKSAVTVLKEQLSNFYLIQRLSLYELKSNNKNNLLGMLWEVINPGIQIAIYWFVFGYGLKTGGQGRSAVGDVPFVIWLLAGMVVWFFISPAIVQSSKSVYTRIRMLSKMSFPMSAIPSYVIMSKFYPHLYLTGITIIIFQFMGYPISVYYLQLPYFMVSVIAVVFAISLITSTLSTMIRDVQMVVQSLIRMLLYLTPILWNMEGIFKGKNDLLLTIMKLNPFYYIVEGYRSSLLGKGWYFVEHAQYTLYFWGLVLVLFMFGSFIHVKFRRHFVDFL